ncbi:MAG: UDP-N-acetylmuramoyl-L-alanine--D-glutamate ligase [Candidatus Nomurabacteria bacterium]|jgi:UDP-N-acetylmuramoylalanine--D-glutamate ligase|nr:UDP-N-acetylmuramoyl-L-alanine--D-glutamate ligase [Candidatus Nomurabacteria bacterium]
MKVAILGYGVEGKSVERYFFERGGEITIFDEGRGDDLGGVNFGEYDLVFRSPAVRPDRVATDKMTSVTRYFFDKCAAKIIGVTGTKGKGTTCSLIAGILREAGKRVWLVGNIGVPALDVLDKVEVGDVVVYELSSFQLWDLENSPKVAVVTMIEADHLDVHKDVDEYLGAKANIVLRQDVGDVVIFDETSEGASKIAGMSVGVKMGYPSGKYEDLLDSLVIPGAHNRKNGEAAILACGCVGVSDDGEIRRGFAGFDGLPHRLKLVREWRGVKFYDDSISTTPGSAVAAIRAFDAPKILILGGSRKGASFAGLVAEVARANVKKVFLIGVSADEIGGLLVAEGYEDAVNLGMDLTMVDVVKNTTEVAEAGDVVILSPACASFDMFESYADRGEKFIDAVKSLEE